VDSFETNKIAGGVLAAAVAILGISIVSGIVYKAEPLKVKGYKVEGVEVETAGPVAAAEKPIAFYLASADPAKGEAGFKKCQTCHNNVKGGPNQIGPNLWGVVGRPIGKAPGFAYSSAVAGHGGDWTWDNISSWIKNPKTYIPQDKMAFAGVDNPQDRANILAYLNTQSEKPLPVPAAPAADAALADTKAASPAATPTADKPAPAPGKAPESRVGQLDATAKAQPSGNVGGPGAAAVTGTSESKAANK